MARSAKPLILYDGFCVLCNRSVAFMQARQRPGALEFAAQHSGRGAAALAPCGLDAQSVETVVFIEGNRCYQRSTAALRALRFLRFPWPLLTVLLLIPPFLRDPVYNLVAHNRYRWFGHLPRE